MPQSTRAIKTVADATPEQETASTVASGVIGIAGFLLCLTGIGAIIGIPMMLGAYQGKKDFRKPKAVYEAPCPYCGLLLHVPTNAVGSNCPACRKRFLIRSEHFVTID